MINNSRIRIIHSKSRSPISLEEIPEEAKKKKPRLLPLSSRTASHSSSSMSSSSPPPSASAVPKSEPEELHTIIEGGEEVVEESPAPKEVQYVVIDKTGADGGGARGVLSRQPSYCKILKDLKEAEEDVVLKEGGASSSETIEVTTSEAPVQTITINGQQYQIVSPASLNESSSASSVVQYAAAANSNGQTVFIPGTLSSGSPPPGQGASSPSSSSSQVITVSPHPPSNNNSSSAAEDASRKREIRLLKNREAARECRNKKKEYIRCLENRVAVLENQNKALIEELKSLKELYTGQKN